MNETQVKRTLIQKNNEKGKVNMIKSHDPAIRM